MSARGGRAGGSARAARKRANARERENGANGAGTAAGVASPPDVSHRELLRSMLLQRRFEERAAEAYAMGYIGGFCHLYIGQEAVGTGAISVLRDDDYVIASYRDHGQALARGVPPRAIMAELFGRVDGVAHGKGGSMHIFDRERNFLGGHGIVGGHIPLATGVGFAIKYRGGDQVCLCFFGEAAVNGGAFHEALNMAALWKLPVIYVIENNRYGMGTALERASAINDIAERACSYDMPNEVVDGQDVLAVREAVARAVHRARAEHIPTLIEARTYRFMGHSMSDAVSGTYRTKEELEEHMKRDPILVLRGVMEKAGEWSDEEMDALDQEVRAIVEDAWQFAEKSAEPPLELLTADVLVDSTSDAAPSPSPVTGD
ncbi:MAG TPA: pyruvate dehydrogenase (acetyl-transferring) E1 component subunit alpha [Gemmatimonadaceae bacterium]|nr:pyruvate dehydrogenase (acetyl-transferring) E1 component subunit alpha [Gemmatimonadaceae bacterium]